MHMRKKCVVCVVVARWGNERNPTEDPLGLPLVELMRTPVPVLVLNSEFKRPPTAGKIIPRILCLSLSNTREQQQVIG